MGEVVLSLLTTRKARRPTGQSCDQGADRGGWSWRDSLTVQADKRERAEKAAREKALREGRAQEAVPVVTAKPAAVVKSSENPETRLQVRSEFGVGPDARSVCMWAGRRSQRPFPVTIVGARG